MFSHSKTPNPKSEIAHRPLPTAYCLLLTAYCLLLLLAGCPKPASVPGGGPAVAVVAGVKLRLVVVGDPELAEAAIRLQGEWNALTRSEDVPAGSEFTVESMTEEELAAAESLPGDAVICPSYLLGPLAEREMVSPLPEELLQDEGSDWGEVSELLRLCEAAWGTDIVAVPFGSPLLTCYYRADLLEKLGRTPPRTWAEYQELAELLADRNNVDPAAGEGAAWSGTIEPLGPGWAGLVLLARAAPYAKHPDNYSTLFNIRSAKLEPLVAGPPFVRALEELVAAAKAGPADQLQYDPAAARAAFWRGQCGMALTWPTAADGLSAAVDKDVRVGFTELPGSTEAYDIGGQTWDPHNSQYQEAQYQEEGEEARVPLLAIAGRIGVVSAKSEHQVTALRLLLWLSGEQSAAKLCASSPATTMFRRSHLNAPRTWVERPVSPSAAAQYGTVTGATFRRQQWLAALRIPGRWEYLSALDEAVGQAVRGELPAAEALQQASSQWTEITRRLGFEKQKTAYLHSLGLE